jgi:hypothetical protein
MCSRTREAKVIREHNDCHVIDRWIRILHQRLPDQASQAEGDATGLYVLEG